MFINRTHYYKYKGLVFYKKKNKVKKFAIIG